jgi:SAM-dependent methyltransferase
MTKTLDLGCGRRPKNPFNADELFGVDVRENLEANIKSADLSIEQIPFDSDSFEYVTAFDFIEHIPRVLYMPQRRNAFVELMSEIYRVLKPGGMFLSMTPAYPHAVAYRDPTHVNIITDETFPMYFDDEKRWATIYGFKGAFSIKVHEWRGPHIFAVMQKVAIPATSHDDLLASEG